MPRYFFDVHDTGTTTDDEGLEYGDLEAAIRAAVETLPAIAAFEIPKEGRDRRHFTIVVRDSHRVPMYVAGLSFCGTRL